MKKSLLFTAIVGLFTSIASATDLYVRDGGAGGSFSTISAAITQASDGDRIIIRPKSAGIPYLENITINKSLTFVSETNFAKYFVQGTITITAGAGRLITINNLNLSSTITVSGATTGGRTTINILNSNLGGDVTASFSNTTLNVSGCTLGTNGIYMSHGRCTANNVARIDVLGAAAADSSPVNEDVEIIGNLITYRLTNNQRYYKFKISNNFFNQSHALLRQAKTGVINEFHNNTIKYPYNLNAPVQVSMIYSNGVISVMNNILSSGTGSGISYEITNDGSELATIYASNNMSDSAFGVSGPVTQSNNIGSAAITINTTNYTVTGANVNAGAIEDDYADLDLTRNDIGHYGGSNSWANYWPENVGNKPQVNYLNTPRRIYTGTQEMNAQGSGYSK
jgi:hypothetical protein